MAEGSGSGGGGPGGGGSGSGGASGPPWLLALSVAVNIVLAIVAGWAGYAKSEAETAKAVAETAKAVAEAAKTRAETQKAALEQQIQLQTNMPAISAFHLMVDFSVLRSFLDSREALPFTTDVKRFSVYENGGFAPMQKRLAEMRPGAGSPGMMVFLIVANAGSATAEGVSLRHQGGKAIALGSLEGRMAVLVPVAFRPARGAEEPYLLDPERVVYEARIGAQRQEGSREIVRLASPLWMPAIGRTIGRANVPDEDQRGAGEPPR